MRFQVWTVEPPLTLLATVDAPSGAEAVARVLHRGQYHHPEELEAIPAPARAKITCRECGWTYQGVPRQDGKGTCTLCRARRRMEMRRRGYEGAVRALQEQRAVRDREQARRAGRKP